MWEAARVREEALQKLKERRHFSRGAGTEVTLSKRRSQGWKERSVNKEKPWTN